ncbi:LysR substrate-binding domain-containing protein [soil metagenome]
MLRYTLRQLEYAISVLDHGSVAQAAAMLGIAQPSLSAALLKLEDQIGLQLFIRHHAQGLSPTPSGQRFLTAARSLVGHAEEIQRQAADSSGTIAGDIAVGCFNTLAPAFAPALMAQFRKAYPQATIRLFEESQTGLIEGLRSGRFDIALLYQFDMPDDLRLTHLMNAPPYALLPAGHALARGRRVSLADLAQEPLILLDILPSRLYFTRILEAHGIKPKIAFQSPSIEVVRGLVGQGLGYSLLVTRPAGDRSYDGKPLAVRPLAEKAEEGVVVLATLKQMRPTRLISTFEAFCVTFFSASKPHKA